MTLFALTYNRRRLYHRPEFRNRHLERKRNIGGAKQGATGVVRSDMYKPPRITTIAGYERNDVIVIIALRACHSPVSNIPCPILKICLARLEEDTK